MKPRVLQSLLFLIVAFGIAGAADAQATYLREYNQRPLFFPQLLAASYGGTLASFGSTLDLDTYFTYFLKTDQNGGFVAGEKYSITGKKLFTEAVTGTSDGGFLLTGLQGPDFQNLDAFALKLNGQGGIQWKRSYSHEILESILEVPDGYLLAGSGAIPNSSYTRMILMKLDKAGNLKWEKGLSSGVSKTGASAFALQTVGSGALLAGVYFENNKNLLMLVRVDSGGKILWARKYNAEGQYTFGAAGSLTVTPEGDILITAVMQNGWTSQARGIAVLKTDSSGTLKWSNFHDKAPSTFSLSASRATSDGGVVLTGAIWPPRPNPGNPVIKPWHAFVAKVNSNGEWEWKRLFDQYDNSELAAVATFPDGTIAASGTLSASLSSRSFAVSTRLSSSGQIYQGCDKFRSFAVSTRKITIHAESIRLQTVAIPLLGNDLNFNTENFKQLGKTVCEGIR